MGWVYANAIGRMYPLKNVCCILERRIMKISFFLLLVFPILSYSQVNPFKTYRAVLQHAQPGKEYFFDQSSQDDLDSLVVVYLGKIVTAKGKVLKFLTSRWYWGSVPRATSRIVIFNEKNQYLGDYCLTMTYDVPGKLENKFLVFTSNKNSSHCPPGVVTRISFKNGIPKQFFVKCNGDIYSFGQSL
jgi:hypothetical protein